MKLSLKYLSLFFFFIFLFSGNLVSFAMNTGFLTEPVSAETEKEVPFNISLYKIDSEPEPLSIRCFDVNEKGLIAIAGKGPGKAQICIYTENGDFQYGYQFETSGDFGFEWDGDNIFIYFVRGQLALLVSSSGEVLTIREIQNTPENRKYWDKVVFARKKTVNGVTYVAKNDLGLFGVLGSKTQLFISDGSGNETLFYDVNAKEFAKLAMIFGLILIFIFVCLFFLTRLIIQSVKSVSQSVKSS